jgi:peptidyl-prolyl cis-trans isomerase SurA
MKFYLSLIFLVNLALPIGAQAKEVVNKIIAIVNSEPILQSELSSFSGRLKKDGAIDESLVLDETTTSLKSDTKKQLEYLIREKMIESEVKKLSLSISEERIDSEMTTLAARNHMSKAQLTDFIKKQGYTLQEYRDNLKGRLEVFDLSKFFFVTLKIRRMNIMSF